MKIINDMENIYTEACLDYKKVNKINNIKKGDENRNKNNNDNICNPVNNNANHAIDRVIDVGSKEQKEKNPIL